MSQLQVDGLVPEQLAPKTRKVLIEDLALSLDIGFHDVEIGNPQRVLVSVEIWVGEEFFPLSDDPSQAWDHDDLTRAIAEAATSRRFSLQESLARAVYDRIAAHRGVLKLRVTMRKPDIYPNCSAGVEMASF